MKSKPAPAFPSISQLISGSILLLDKPYGWTSFDLVNKVKWFVRNNFPEIKFSGEGKLRIGHAGTLDPLATGLVVLCTGKFTKEIESLQQGEKEYTGTVCFGQTTPSYDLETQPEGNFRTDHLNEEMLKKAAAGFLGEQWQRPPIFSAKQVDGMRAYHAARKGQDMIIPATPVRIFEFEITRFQNPEADFRIRCSKGTYIRSIANDIGQKLETGSYLKTLRRTASHPYMVEDAITPDELSTKLQLMIAGPTA